MSTEGVQPGGGWVAPEVTGAPLPPPALEGDLLEMVREELGRAGFARWLMGSSLPPGHALEGTPEGDELRVVKAGTGEERHTLDVVLEHPVLGWRLLIVVTARVTERLTREQHDATRARAGGFKERREVNGSVVVVLGPRRYLRDSGHAGRYTRVITTAHLGDWYAARAAAGGADAESAWEKRRRLIASEEHHVREAAAAKTEKARHTWGEYDAAFAPFAAHLTMLPRGAGTEVRFALSPGRSVEGLPAVALVHDLALHRAALVVSGLGAGVGAVASRLREELPMDMFIEERPGVLVLWLRLPPVSVAGRFAGQRDDLRHAFGALWRLKRWYLKHVEDWRRWRGMEEDGE